MEKLNLFQSLKSWKQLGTNIVLRLGKLETEADQTNFIWTEKLIGKKLTPLLENVKLWHT